MVRRVDVPDVHHFGRFQRYGDDFFAVRIGIQGAGGDVVSPDIPHQLEHGGFIGNDDVLLRFFGRVEFFREVEGVI